MSNRWKQFNLGLAFLATFCLGGFLGNVDQAHRDRECKNPEMLFSAEGTDPSYWVYQCDGREPGDPKEVKAYRWPLDSDKDLVTM